MSQSGPSWIYDRWCLVPSWRTRLDSMWVLARRMKRLWKDSESIQSGRWSRSQRIGGSSVEDATLLCPAGPLGELFQKAGRKDGGLDGIGGILQDIESQSNYGSTVIYDQKIYQWIIRRRVNLWKISLHETHVGMIGMWFQMLSTCFWASVGPPRPWLSTWSRSWSFWWIPDWASVWTLEAVFDAMTQ